MNRTHRVLWVALLCHKERRLQTAALSMAFVELKGDCALGRSVCDVHVTASGESVLRHDPDHLVDHEHVYSGDAHVVAQDHGPLARRELAESLR